MQTICSDCPLYSACYQNGSLQDQDHVCHARIRETRALLPHMPMVSSSGAQIDYYPCCYLADFLCQNVDASWHSAFDGVLASIKHVYGFEAADGVALCTQWEDHRRRKEQGTKTPS